MSGSLRKALPTRHQAAGYANHAAQSSCKLVRFCQSLQSRIGSVADEEKRVVRFKLKKSINSASESPELSHLLL